MPVIGQGTKVPRAVSANKVPLLYWQPVAAAAALTLTLVLVAVAAANRSPLSPPSTENSIAEVGVIPMPPPLAGSVQRIVAPAEAEPIRIKAECKPGLSPELAAAAVKGDPLFGALAPAPEVVVGDLAADVMEEPLLVPPVAVTSPMKETFGTAVAFERNMIEAARLAKQGRKLLFLLHVSGNFEEAEFT